MTGGYDDGYQSCPCFWGHEPGSLVQWLTERERVAEWPVLDAGCGEGKNAIFLARQRARVIAIDVSRLAIRNAMTAWPDAESVRWAVASVQSVRPRVEAFRLVVAYGLFHCLIDPPEIQQVVRALKSVTTLGGYHVICAFNDRSQDLSGHPGFRPTLLRHDEYLSLYRDWDICVATDSDLQEAHPHNGVLHTHSLTRIVAKRIDRRPTA